MKRWFALALLAPLLLAGCSSKKDQAEARVNGCVESKSYKDAKVRVVNDGPRGKCQWLDSLGDLEDDGSLKPGA